MNQAITAPQCRAGRALLGISRADLAAAANVAERTIADFESGARKPIPATLAALRRAMEGMGVCFTEHGVELPPRA